LLGVADEHQLGFGPGAGFDQAGQLAGPDHRGFIDQDDGSPVQRLVTGVEVEEEAIEGAAGDARARLQAPGGSGGEGAAQHPGAARLPRGPGGVEGEGLARAGSADDDVDVVAACGDPPHHRNLLVGERRPGTEGVVDTAVIGGSVPAGPTTQGDGYHPFLQRQHLGRRPPAVGYLDDERAGHEGSRPLLDLRQAGAVRCGGGHRPHRLGRVEGGGVQGDATGEGIVGGQGGE